MLCPKCGTENTEQAKVCVNCQESLVADTSNVNTIAEQQNQESIAQESLDVEKKAAAVKSKATRTRTKEEKPIVTTGMNAFVIIGTIIFPVVGVAMGYTYFRKDHPDAKKAGKNWMILGGVMFLINMLLVSLMK